MQFDLIEEPWLPCTMLDGSPAELGIRETLANAAAIRELDDASPVVTAAIHRLLLAVLHRNFGPKNEAEWKHLWERGSWNEELLLDYFVRWRERFNLFGEKHPFYQVPSLDFAYEGPISKLVAELASGNNATLFDHSSDNAIEPISAAQAARLLAAHHCFAVGGLVSLEKGQDPKRFKSADAAPLAKGAIVIVKGRNLFETLMLNLVNYNPEDEEPFPANSNDVPAWERDTETQATDRVPDGYLDLLTRQSRRIRLHPESLPDGRIVVRKVVIMKGNQFPDGFSRRGRETMLAFRRRPKAIGNEDPWPAVSFSEERALWRDSTALFQSVEEERWRPVTLDWLDDLAQRGILDRKLVLNLDLLGIATDKAKVLLWRHERLPLPLEYLDNKSLLAALQCALRAAEEVKDVLIESVRKLAQLLLAPTSDSDERDAPPANRDEVKSMLQALAPERRYWPRLETPFRELLLSLPSDRSAGPEGEEIFGAKALPAWEDTLKQRASRAFEETVRTLETNARSLKAIARAERDFRGGLRAALTTLRSKEEASDAAESA